MRKYIKGQLLLLTDQLLAVNHTFRKLIKRGKREKLINALAEEQETALYIGESIEASEGEGTKAVKLLEQYCEALWAVSQEQDRWKQEEQLQVLSELIDQAVQELQQLPEQIEVVFLPYKASMWDCMESVWEAASKDPDCICHVIPVPFFDRKPDGTLGELHYEGKQLPEYVQITSYEEYDISEMHPEVIYIHNPFDDCNTVTSVEPRFYSYNLKKHTDMLVYIPYFMMDEKMPESHRFLPSYKNIDRIVLQNEEAVREFAQYVPKEKLLALGSAKLDRMLSVSDKKEEIINSQLPDGWKDKITGKKVFLYNVSISGVLENSEYVVEKIKYVLSVFCNQRGAVLLWRPHPLIESTLQSMRPELYSQYMDLKQNFIHNDYGIFDDSPDVTRAAVIADAYIGDASSSLIHYFRSLGKPLFFIDWKIIKTDMKGTGRFLYFTDCWIEDHSIWFVPRSQPLYHYLCKTDLDKGTTALEADLPGEKENPVKGNAYFGIGKVQNNIILVPVWCSDIYIYRTDLGQAAKLPLRTNSFAPNFSNCFEYKGRVFLSPRNYPAVVEIDINNTSLIYHERIPSGPKSFEDEFRFGIGSAARDNLLYIPCADRNSVLIFDMENGGFTEKNIEGTQTGFYSLMDDGKMIWLIGNKNADIFSWNTENGEIVKYHNLPVDFIGGKQPFRSIVDCASFIVIFPETANMLLKIEKGSEGISEYKLWQSGEKDLEINTNSEGFFWAKKYGGRMLALNAKGKTLLIQPDTGECRNWYCNFNENDRRKIDIEELGDNYQKYYVPNGCWENTECSIPAFIEYIIQGKYTYHTAAQEQYAKIVGNTNGTCGINIHNNIKGGLISINGK